MTLHRRSHAVRGLRNVITSRATCETSFNSSTSRRGSDDINFDEAVRRFDVMDNAAGAAADSDDRSMAVKGLNSSTYMLIDDDDAGDEDRLPTLLPQLLLLLFEN